MEQFSEELKREYFNALYNQQSGNNEPMKRFILAHKELYQVVNAMYHKRKIIRDNYYAMKMVSNNIVAGALTFDSEHDIQSIATKRKQVSRHLGKYLTAYIFIEELGELRSRYHIHFIGILKECVSYLDFVNAWHSRAEIQKVISIKKSINYLTDYVVKQVPRVRRNASLINLYNHYKKSISWSNYGFKSFAEEEKQNAIINLVFEL